MSKSLSKDRLATCMLIITAFIWGLGFVAQRAAMDHVQPFTFNAVRFGLGGLSLLPLAIKLEKAKLTRDTVIAGLAIGGILFIAAALQQIGITITGSASKAGFITGLYIVLVPVLGIFVGRRTSKFVWMGAVLATIGLYLIGAPEGLTALDVGTILLLICAFCWAVHILVIDRFVTKIKPITLMVFQALICSALSFIAAFVFEDMQMAQIVAGRVPIFFSAFISVGIAYTLQIIAQQYVPPGRSAVIFSMESVVAAGGEAVILGDFLDGRGYAGGAMIFIGIIISQLKDILKNNKKVGEKP